MCGALDDISQGTGLSNIIDAIKNPQNAFVDLRNNIETGADLAGNYFLPGSSILTNNLVSKGSQGQLNTVTGQLADIGSGLAGAGVGSGITGIPSAAQEGAGWTNAANGLGGVAGDPTLGTDIGSSLSNFANSTGLSSLYGGTSQPANALNADYSGISSGAPGSGDLASAASTPNFSAGNTLTTGGGNALSSGGGTLGTGGTDAFAGESLAAPSSSGIGAGGTLGSDVGNFGSGIGGTTSLGASADNGIPATDSLSGFGAQQGGSGLSNLYGNLTGSPNIPSGSFNYDFSGNPVGASALSPSDPAYAATASNNLGQGNNMGTLSGILGGGATGGSSGGAGTNIMNGLLRGGLGYLLNSPNNQGKDAINSAVGAGQAAYAPYLAAGNQAEGQLANLYGNNGTAAQNTAFSNFQNTPGYQFAEQQGLNAVNANAAAMGSPLSGNNQQAVNNYAQGTANQTYNNYVNQLQNMASGGANAAGGSANLGLTGTGATSQIGQNNANNQNAAIGQGLQGLFPTGLSLQQLLGNSMNNNGSGGLLSYL